MYIPYSFFGSSNPCITASVSLVSGNGKITSGSYVSQSILYDFYQFEMTSLTNTTLTSSVFNFEIKSGSTQNAKILIVGGGAGGATTGSIYDQSYNYVVDAAGGGGGGGIVYYENFTLSPGLYEIGVGKAAYHGIAATYPGNNNLNILGITGSNSYFKNKNIAYPPFNTDTFTAYGGGNQNARGEFYSFNDGHRTKTIFGVGGGCGGGASSGESQAPYPSGVGSLDGTAGNSTSGSFNYGPQGYKGGWFSGGDVSQGINYGYATGGGGAGAAGQNTGTGSYSIYASDGGVGRTFNMNGTASMYSGGGAGLGGNPGSSPQQVGTRGGSSYGAGGNGWGGGQSETLSIGNAGVVIIHWPRCTIEPLVSPNYILQNCENSQIRTATFSNGPVLTAGQVITTTNTYFTGSGCWQVTGTTGSAQYENIALTNIYNSCATCTGSICYSYGFINVITGGGNVTYTKCDGTVVTEKFFNVLTTRCVKYGTTPVYAQGSSGVFYGTLCTS